MVKAARAQGLEFKWVLANSAYGCSLEFCRQIEALKYQYMMDAAGTTRVWDADPEPVLPAEGEGGRRSRAKILRGNSQAKRHKLGELVEKQFANQAKEVTIRETTKGPLRAKVLILSVWLWEEGAERPERRTVVARQYEDGRIKVSWTNAPEGSRAEELAYIQAQRHWIERSFEDAKSELGMAEYEVRKWRGWHHHMTLVSLAMLFVLKERISHAESIPLLSTRDIVELLNFYLPRRGHTEEEVMQDLMRRHRQRQQASASHARRSRGCRFKIETK